MEPGHLFQPKIQAIDNDFLIRLVSLSACMDDKLAGSIEVESRSSTTKYDEYPANPTQTNIPLRV